MKKGMQMRTGLGPRLGPQFSQRKVISDCPRCEHRKIENRMTQMELDDIHVRENHKNHTCPQCQVVWTCVADDEKVPGNHEWCLSCMAKAAGLTPIRRETAVAV